MNESGNGYLRVRVTEARGAFPVEGATVQISEYPGKSDTAEAEAGEAGGTILYSLTTNENGLTPIVSLPAPPSSQSMSPGAAQPYSVYNISVTYDGYYPVEGVSIPIFDKITAIQPVDMQPLTEEDRIAGANDGRVMIYETPDSASLQPGGEEREDIGNQNGTITGGAMTSRNNAGGSSVAEEDS